MAMRDWDQTDVEAALTAREAQRRDALVAGDRSRLADLLTDDLVHVHTSGQAHGKTQLLHHAIDFLEFLDVTRGPLTIRVLASDAAVMTGAMTNVVRARGKDERVEVRAFVTQVWQRQDGQWRIASFHACRLPQE